MSDPVTVLKLNKYMATRVNNFINESIVIKDKSALSQCNWLEVKSMNIFDERVYYFIESLIEL